MEVNLQGLGEKQVEAFQVKAKKRVRQKHLDEFQEDLKGLIAKIEISGSIWEGLKNDLIGLLKRLQTGKT